MSEQHPGRAAVVKALAEAMAHYNPELAAQRRRERENHANCKQL